MRYATRLTGVVRYRQTFWRRHMVLQVQEECQPLLCYNAKPDTGKEPFTQWRDATWQDIRTDRAWFQVAVESNG